MKGEGLRAKPARRAFATRGDPAPFAPRQSRSQNGGGSTPSARRYT